VGRLGTISCHISQLKAACIHAQPRAAMSEAIAKMLSLHKLSVACCAIRNGKDPVALWSGLDSTTGRECAMAKIPEKQIISREVAVPTHRMTRLMGHYGLVLQSLGRVSGIHSIQSGMNGVVVAGETEEAVARVAEAIKDLSSCTNPLESGSISPLLQRHLERTQTVIVPARVLERTATDHSNPLLTAEAPELKGAGVGDASSPSELDPRITRLPSPDLSLTRMPGLCLLEVVSGDITPRQTEITTKPDGPSAPRHISTGADPRVGL
jgi:hypothetical protein